MIAGYNVSFVSVIKIILTPVFPQYSFITTWIVFYISIPLLRTIITSMNIAQLRKLAVVFFLIVPAYNFIWNNVGSHLLSFYYMFFLVALLSRDAQLDTFLKSGAKKIFVFLSLLLLILVVATRIIGDMIGINLFSIVGMRL